MKLQLPNTTLVCCDCINLERTIPVLEKCKELVDFGVVKLLTNLETDYEHKVEIAPLNTLVAYSIFMLKKIHEYVDTTHMLIVQHDGWILYPEMWNEEWTNLDYLCPIFHHYDIMGVGGFSYRSKALMKSVSEKIEHWNGTQEDADRIQVTLGSYEDGVIAMNLRKTMESEGFKYATVEQGSKFANSGNNNFYEVKPFGFHRGPNYTKPLGGKGSE